MTSWFGLIPYFHQENNEGLKDWAKWWALLCFVKCSLEIHIFSFLHRKKTYHNQKFTKHWLSNWVSIARVAAFLSISKVSLLLPTAVASNWETPCVCPCQSDQPRICWSAAPRDQNFQMPSGIDVGRNGQITSWGLNFGPKLTSASWTAKCHKIKLCGVWVLLRQAVTVFQCSSPDWFNIHFKNQ